MAGRIAQAFQRVDHAELRVCRYVNRSADIGAVSRFFRAVSWLGDGWVWYALIAVLPVVYGARGSMPAAHLALTGAVGLLLYKMIKRRAVRERPFVTHSAIHCASAPLDRYSFPSGHTLHAVSFTIVTVGHFPEWVWPLSVLTSLIALSRVILGLHYPTDVAAGATLGGALGMISLEAGLPLAA
ncbi:MAG: phosphatase PAP2 family protein [Gammaproteobacteria bacterium]|nr:phosphatase PAP2 family protein [Gammaproteobacteria bacterium]